MKSKFTYSELKEIIGAIGIDFDVNHVFLEYLYLDEEHDVFSLFYKALVCVSVSYHVQDVFLNGKEGEEGRWWFTKDYRCLVFKSEEGVLIVDAWHRRLFSDADLKKVKDVCHKLQKSISSLMSVTRRN